MPKKANKRRLGDAIAQDGGLRANQASRFGTFDDSEPGIIRIARKTTLDRAAVSREIILEMVKNVIVAFEAATTSSPWAPAHRALFSLAVFQYYRGQHGFKAKGRLGCSIVSIDSESYRPNR